MPETSIILLNGASSSGKSTLARALRKVLDAPYFMFSSDQLVEAGILPAVDREARTGERAWATIRPRFFDGFHRCIAALANAGNPLLVEHVIEFRPWMEDCVRLLAPHDVFYVGVHCPLPELERRERARGDRWIGEGESHLQDGIHGWGPYDLEVDTSMQSPEENALRIKAAHAGRRRPSAFRRMRRCQLDGLPLTEAACAAGGSLSAGP